MRAARGDRCTARFAPARALDALVWPDRCRILTEPALITQALAPLLALGNKPRVLCITSQLGSIAQAAGFRTISYAMSKAALNMAVKRLAAELVPRGIVVLAVHPGWVKTAMGGKGATLAPTDSAHALLDLIEHAQAQEAGRFLAYDGAELPW